MLFDTTGGCFLFRGYTSSREDPGVRGPGRAPGPGEIDPRHEKEPPPHHAHFRDRPGYSGYVPEGCHPRGLGISSLIFYPPEEMAHATREEAGHREEVPGAATSPAALLEQVSHSLRCYLDTCNPIEGLFVMRIGVHLERASEPCEFAVFS